MLEFSTLRAYLEIGYFLAGILILFGLLLAYRQLSLLRLDINLRNERAAKEKAIAACERYMDVYVQKSGVFYNERVSHKLPNYDGPIGDFTPKSIPENLRNFAAQKLILESILPALNELESIAASFHSGVADEKTGFQIIGRSFCATVQYHYDAIAFCRSQEAQGYWSQIVGLYSIWRPRLTRKEMEVARDRLNQTLISFKDVEIPPFGVDRV